MSHGHEADASHASHTGSSEGAEPEYPADEPHSPAWLPLLGVALFCGLILVFAVARAGDNPAADGAAAPPPSPSVVSPPGNGVAVRPGAPPAAGPAQPVQRMPVGAGLPPAHP